MVLAGALRIELRLVDLESTALTTTPHPSIKQDALHQLKGQIKTAPIIYVNVLLCASLIFSTLFIFFLTSRHFNIFVNKKWHELLNILLNVSYFWHRRFGVEPTLPGLEPGELPLPYAGIFSFHFLYILYNIFF